MAANFERFDGLEPLDHPASDTRLGYNYGEHPRPGQLNQPLGQVYTPGPLSATVGVLGGQPLPVANRIFRPEGAQTPVVAPTLQYRMGVGQNYSGIQQTIALARITNNPPQPEDITDIISGWA